MQNGKVPCGHCENGHPMHWVSARCLPNDYEKLGVVRVMCDMCKRNVYNGGTVRDESYLHCVKCAYDLCMACAYPVGKHSNMDEPPQNSG